MTLFLRTERPLPAGKRPKVNASAEENEFVRLYDDEEEEIAFSMVASLRCGPNTVQSADTVEISPMEIPPIIPPAPSAARLLTRDWKSSVVRTRSKKFLRDNWEDFTKYYVSFNCTCSFGTCPEHEAFLAANPGFDLDGDDFECGIYTYDVYEPVPMTKEELKAEFPSYLNAWSTHIDGFPSSALFTAFNDWLDSRGLSFEVLSIPVPPPCPKEPLAGFASVCVPVRSIGDGRVHRVVWYNNRRFQTYERLMHMGCCDR